MINLECEICINARHARSICTLDEKLSLFSIVVQLYKKKRKRKRHSRVNNPVGLISKSKASAFEFFFFFQKCEETGIFSFSKIVRGKSFSRLNLPLFAKDWSLLLKLAGFLEFSSLDSNVQSSIFMIMADRLVGKKFVQSLWSVFKFLQFSTATVSLLRDAKTFLKKNKLKIGKGTISSLKILDCCTFKLSSAKCR